MGREGDFIFERGGAEGSPVAQGCFYMGWFKRWLEKRNNPKVADKEKDDVLIEELWRAHKDWMVAQRKLDFAIDKDEIDYAIYITEAAERRYDMLIRQAKASYMERSRQQEEMLNRKTGGS